MCVCVDVRMSVSVSMTNNRLYRVGEVTTSKSDENVFKMFESETIMYGREREECLWVLLETVMNVEMTE